MTPLPKYRDDPAKLTARINAARRDHHGYRDLERRRVVAVARQIRREVREGKRSAAKE